MGDEKEVVSCETNPAIIALEKLRTVVNEKPNGIWTAKQIDSAIDKIIISL